MLLVDNLCDRPDPTTLWSEFRIVVKVLVPSQDDVNQSLDLRFVRKWVLLIFYMLYFSFLFSLQDQDGHWASTAVHFWAGGNDWQRITFYRCQPAASAIGSTWAALQQNAQIVTNVWTCVYHVKIFPLQTSGFNGRSLFSWRHQFFTNFPRILLVNNLFDRPDHVLVPIQSAGPTLVKIGELLHIYILHLVF